MSPLTRAFAVTCGIYLACAVWVAIGNTAQDALIAAGVAAALALVCGAYDLGRRRADGSGTT